MIRIDRLGQVSFAFLSLGDAMRGRWLTTSLIVTSLVVVGAVVAGWYVWAPMQESSSVAGSDSVAEVTVMEAKSDVGEGSSSVANRIGAQLQPIMASLSLPAGKLPQQTSSKGFVSSDACRECHAEQYDSWHDSYHRSMTQLATPDAVIGDFSVGTVNAYGRDFVLSRRGDEFWVNMHDPETQVTENAERIDRRIIMTTGSHLMQMYWYAGTDGRELGQLPIAWLCETEEWVPRDALFISPPPQPLRPTMGRWNAVCIKCHTTHGQPRVDPEGEQPADSHVGELGISCEACHGPGDEHVRWHRSSEAGSTGNDQQPDALRDVVHPLKTDHRVSSQVCGQCHGIWFENSEQRHHEFLTNGRAFIAGDQISQHGHVFGTDQPVTPYVTNFLKQNPHFAEDRFWSDGMARVSGSDFSGMMRSPCYERGTLACTSCHQMHHDSSDDRIRSDWATDQLKPEALGRESCLQCHERFRDDDVLVKHTHHSTKSSGSDCYNCHMPHTTYGLVKAIRSHEITSPDAKVTVDVGRPNACNLCHLDKTLAWTADHLNEWYEIEPPENLSHDQQHVADSIIWSLSGDAGQRALAAASLGWQPAKDASRIDWVTPVLGQLMIDPYDAVRLVAFRSLRSYAEFADLEFHYTGDLAERKRVVGNLIAAWSAAASERAASPEASVLISENGGIDRVNYVRLLESRDNREVLLAE